MANDLIFNISNIELIIEEKGIDWLIDNTCKIIKRYSKRKSNRSDPRASKLGKLNKTIIWRYTRLLKLLNEMKELDKQN